MSLVGRRPVRPVRWWLEVLAIAVFYAVYSATRNTQGSARVSAAEALDNAVRLIDLERRLGLYHERAVQEAFLPYDSFIEFWNLFYGTFHFVLTGFALVLLFRRFPERYRFWRNVLACTTALALVGFATYPLMPPRLLPASYGFVDTLKVYGSLWSFDSGTMQKLSNQYAAMPSLHFAWAVWSTCALVPVLRRRPTRALALAYPALTLFAVVVTGNHYVLDAAAAGVLLLAGVAAAQVFARLADYRRQPEDGTVDRARPTAAPPGAPVAVIPEQGEQGEQRAMLLDRIESPADLRSLSHDELNTLAGEIREFVVKAVAVTGGHLGSNLGVVELTLALHRVFHSPHDVLLWDTGHQAYAHKIVTGRKDLFASLRQPGGLSGYPSRQESTHDWVENSHASTILSWAHGLATALELRGERDRRVVAVIGDGSMTGGMAYEALNNLGHSGKRVIIVLNDNGRSYAPTVSRWVSGLTRLRLHPSYVRSRDRIQRLLRDVPMVGEHLERGVEGVRAALREVLEPGEFFEALGVRYVGPISGHDLPTVERTLGQAAEQDGPIIVHVLTQKGRGYRPAEDDDEKCLHDAPVFDPLTGPPPWAPMGYTQAFSEAVLDAAERDSRVVAITAAMPGPTGLLPFQARFPDRFVDVGIAEQHAVTAAAGMALGGLRPVVAVYSTFLTRGFDQVNLDVGLHRLPVVFCLDRAGITGDDGPSHHGVLDLALLSRVPGMTIFAPSSAQELRVMLREALRITDGPVTIRYPKGAARQVGPDQVGSGLSARLVTEGGDVCILAVGAMLEAAEEAAGLLGDQGVRATVWDVRVAKPLDPAMVASAAAHPLVVTVEDGVRQGGVGTAVADAVAGVSEGRFAPPVLVLGIPDAHLAQGKRAAILAELGLDGPGIAASVVRALGPAEATAGARIHAVPR